MQTWSSEVPSEVGLYVISGEIGLEVGSVMVYEVAELFSGLAMRRVGLKKWERPKEGMSYWWWWRIPESVLEHKTALTAPGLYCSAYEAGSLIEAARFPHGMCYRYLVGDEWWEFADNSLRFAPIPIPESE